MRILCVDRYSVIYHCGTIVMVIAVCIQLLLRNETAVTYGFALKHSPSNKQVGCRSLLHHVSDYGLMRARPEMKNWRSLYKSVWYVRLALLVCL
jgi:hypothetical protein